MELDIHSEFGYWNIPFPHTPIHAYMMWYMTYMPIAMVITCWKVPKTALRFSSSPEGLRTQQSCYTHGYSVLQQKEAH